MSRSRAIRIASHVLIGAGVLVLVWAIVVWRWEDPFTALYTHWQQEKLAHALDREFAAYSPSPPTRSLALAAQREAVAAEAARFRRNTHSGEAIGRIVIGRIGLNMVVVDGHPRFFATHRYIVYAKLVAMTPR